MARRGERGEEGRALREKQIFDIKHAINDTVEI